MIPEYAVDGSATIPEGFSYWTPDRSDIDYENGEGLGFFQGTWLVLNVPLEEARMLVNDESSLLDQVDKIAQSEEEFETLAGAIESAELDELEIDDLCSREGWPELLEQFPTPDDSFAGGLELGVAGLTLTLAALGLVPVASCRSHAASNNSWSDCPVVFFASDESRARAIAGRASQHGCSIGTGGEGRAHFLTVYAGSVRILNQLASALLNDASDIGTDSIIRDDEPEGAAVNPNQLGFEGL